jgi:hypothetical protein
MRGSAYARRASVSLMGQEGAVLGLPRRHCAQQPLRFGQEGHAAPPFGVSMGKAGRPIRQAGHEGRRDRLHAGVKLEQLFGDLSERRRSQGLASTLLCGGENSRICD